MKKPLLLFLFLVSFFAVTAKTYRVKNIAELNAANKIVQPGDEIIFANGNWHNVTISLDAFGTEEKPIIIKAETAGKVNITGISKLLIGGKYLVVDGLYFNNGYSSDNSVIKFRTKENKLANYCRLTNIVINDFNAKRMEETYWVALYGKHNRIDHCSFINKKNMGVLVVVMLDTEDSRENDHSIDHNYFGVRLPLASNTGEIIRVGVSTYSEYNSNTKITNNHFYHCDGETEVVSIKSGGNLVKDNLIEESQGSVVLRHGDYNTVANNVFLGNDKPGTGGVRIINKGQWVINNFFYKCRGIDFRSPLSIMNGVPNSPKNRYVAVTDALVANNSFINCTPISFGEGSDAERSVAPKEVSFVNNLFYNTGDSLIYHAFDDISRIYFADNAASGSYKQKPAPGFFTTNIQTVMADELVMPVIKKASYEYPDSIKEKLKTRGDITLSTSPGFTNKEMLLQTIDIAQTNTGAKWYKVIEAIPSTPVLVNCNNAADVEKKLAFPQTRPLHIILTGSSYNFTRPIVINSDVTFSTAKNEIISISLKQKSDFLFLVNGGGKLKLQGLKINLTTAGGKTLISGDTSGSSGHANIIIDNCSFGNYNGSFFTAPKSNVSDSIIISNSSFNNFKNGLLNFMSEDDKKGYYNVEHLVIRDNKMININGQILGMLRSGNDESTMGPNLLFENNLLQNCNSGSNALIYLYGTQVSMFLNNSFQNCNPRGTILKLEDKVRAHHHLENNNLQNSGKIEGNEFVE